MTPQAVLIFSLDDASFGVDATQVRESVWLPELTPAEEAPSWVVGLFSLRGRIVPVIDLRLRLGHPARPYGPDDQVVVLESGTQAMGLIVDEVREVIELPGEALQTPPQFDAAGPGHLVTGEARVGGELVTLLDVARLLSFHDLPTPAFPQAEPAPSPAGQGPGWGQSGHYFSPQATPDERALFHARAQALADTGAEEEGEPLGLAVIELAGEYFGVELASVREFCEVEQTSPIPCCPSHILGVMKLRGDLLTLIDPRAALNLPAAGRAGAKAVVGRLGEQAAAIAVDAVHDVVYLRGAGLQAPPPALRERGGPEILGTAPYAGRTMTVLDLPALLAREDWGVDETV